MKPFHELWEIVEDCSKCPILYVYVFNLNPHGVQSITISFIKPFNLFLTLLESKLIEKGPINNYFRVLLISWHMENVFMHVRCSLILPHETSLVCVDQVSILVTHIYEVGLVSCLQITKPLSVTSHVV